MTVVLFVMWITSLRELHPLLAMGTLSAAIESQTQALKATQDAMKVIMEAANAQAQQTQ